MTEWTTNTSERLTRDAHFSIITEWECRNHRGVQKYAWTCKTLKFTLMFDVSHGVAAWFFWIPAVQTCPTSGTHLPKSQRWCPQFCLLVYNPIVCRCVYHKSYSWCTCTIAYSILLCLDWPCFMAIFDLHQASPSLAYASVRRPAMAHMKQPLAKLGLGRLLVRKNIKKWAWLWTAKLQQIGTREWSNWRVHGPWAPHLRTTQICLFCKNVRQKIAKQQEKKSVYQECVHDSMTYKLAYIQFF